MPAHWNNWWACSEPERPCDPWTSFDEDCIWCLGKAKLYLATNPVDTPREFIDANGNSSLLTLAQFVKLYGEMITDIIE